MTENLSMALQLLVQGMAGIFVVLGVIALSVQLLHQIDKKKKD